MAEITWKATFIGAFILFLIGVVVATCLNYAQPSLRSIRAGIDGPFGCLYNSSRPNSRISDTLLCNETNKLVSEDCIYIYVSYTDRDTNEVTPDILLSPSYRYSKEPLTPYPTSKQKELGPVSNTSIKIVLCKSLVIFVLHIPCCLAEIQT